jgi:hypothetical protein
VLSDLKHCGATRAAHRFQRIGNFAERATDASSFNRKSEKILAALGAFRQLGQRRIHGGLIAGLAKPLQLLHLRTTVMIRRSVAT